MTQEKIDEIIRDTKQCLETSDRLLAELNAMGEHKHFLLDEYRTNPGWFGEDGSVEDIIKTCFEYGWTCRRSFDDECGEKEGKDYETTDTQVAAELAEKLYEDFFNELMTALGNSVKNFEGAMRSTCDGNAISYYQGKMHAFNEISERLVKEYNLVLNNELRYNGNCERILQEIKNRKNLEVDGLIPEYKYRGSRFYDVAMRFKGKLADILESFSSKAFLLGLKLGKTGEPDKFNPVAFEQLCNDKFVGEKFMDGVRYMEDPEYRKKADAGFSETKTAKS